MIVVFDGECLMCNAWVQFLLRRRGGQTIRFATMQGEAGRRLLERAGLDVDHLETLLVVDGERSWQHTDAILRLFASLGWPWRALCVARLLPRTLRDSAYRWLARNRYRLFGRRDHCMLPAPAHRGRFLE